MHPKTAFTILITLLLPSGCARDEPAGPTAATVAHVKAAATSKIAFARGGNIYTIAPDGSEETRLTTNAPSSRHNPGWSPDGSMIVFQRATDDFFNHDLFRINADGSGETQLIATASESEQYPSWSPDGQHIAFTAVADGGLQIFVMNLNGSARKQLTTPPGQSFHPTWSLRGRLAFSTDRDGNWEIYAMNRGGSRLTRLTNSPGADFAPSWSPDGQRIAFEHEGQIHVMNADGSSAANLGAGSGIDPSWSPDGQKLAFTCEGNDRFTQEICVMNADGSGVVRITDNTAQENHPSWSPGMRH